MEQQKKPGKGLGVPGGMIKITEFMIVSVPFPRQVFPIAEPDKENPGKLRTHGVVRYLYKGTWLDASTLLTRWQPWRDIVIEPSNLTGKTSVGSASVANQAA